MKIGFCYDTKEDYGYESDNLNFTDFVSLNTVCEIKRALEDLGYEVVYIGNIDKLKDYIENKKEKVDFVFNIAEGINSRNREAIIPAYLEAHNIAYSGSDAFAMAITLNKHFTKVLVQQIGISVPNGFTYTEVNSSIIDKLNSFIYPIVIKPNSEGGSMGLRLVHNLDDFIQNSISLINNFGYELLCEEYIEGKEITVPIIGNGESSKALGVVAIMNADNTDISLYDAEQKQLDNVINTLQIDCPIEVLENIKKDSLKIHQLFKINDYSRMDFRLKANGQYYFLETNLLPSLVRGGSFELCGKTMNKSYTDIIDWILKSALKRSNRI